MGTLHKYQRRRDARGVRLEVHRLKIAAGCMACTALQAACEGAELCALQTLNDDLKWPLLNQSIGNVALMLTKTLTWFDVHANDVAT